MINMLKRVGTATLPRQIPTCNMAYQLRKDGKDLLSQNSAAQFCTASQLALPNSSLAGKDSVHGQPRGTAGGESPPDSKEQGWGKFLPLFACDSWQLAVYIGLLIYRSTYSLLPDKICRRRKCLQNP